MYRFRSVRYFLSCSILIIATTHSAFAESLETLLQELDKAGDAQQICGAVATSEAEASNCAFGYCSDNGDIPVTADPGSELVCKYRCDDLAAKAACAQKMVDDFFKDGSSNLPSCSGWCFSGSNSCTLVGLLGIGDVDIDIIRLPEKGMCAYQYGIPYGDSGSVRASCSCESIAQQ